VTRERDIKNRKVKNARPGKQADEQADVKGTRKAINVPPPEGEYKGRREARLERKKPLDVGLMW